MQDETAHLDPADVWRSVERHRATSLLIVGDSFARPLIDHWDAHGGYDVGSLRHVLSGGAVLSPMVRAGLIERLPGVTVVDVLGSTESGRQAVATASRGRDASGFRPESTAIVLSEDRSRRLTPADDSIGWLAQTGAVPLGYLGDPDATRATFPVLDGTRLAIAGDRARYRPDGGIDLLGRDSVTINTGGEKVFAEEVETALKTHPAVFDAVVCGRPSERWGEEVVGVVALRSGVEAGVDELRSWCRRDLADFKAPKGIVFVPSVVRSPSGKADYRWARDVAAGR
jgi:acyl-CoA synthetase (AMP-forming)/AMP-acid ligase II